MYTEQDYQDISKQVQQRALIVAVPSVLLLAFVIFSFTRRWEYATMASTFVLGAYLIASIGLLLNPVTSYKRHMDNVLHGRVHEMTGCFKEMEEQTVIREGVKYYPVMLNVGDMNEEKDDRLFYYDANLPRPDWKTGEMLTFTYHDKAVGNWKRV